MLPPTLTPTLTPTPTLTLTLTLTLTYIPNFKRPSFSTMVTKSRFFLRKRNSKTASFTPSPQNMKIRFPQNPLYPFSTPIYPYLPLPLTLPTPPYPSLPLPTPYLPLPTPYLPHIYPSLPLPTPTYPYLPHTYPYLPLPTS